MRVEGGGDVAADDADGEVAALEAAFPTAGFVNAVVAAAAAAAAAAVLEIVGQSRCFSSFEENLRYRLRELAKLRSSKCQIVFRLRVQ